MTVNFPSPPVAEERNNLGTGLLAGVCTAIVAALAYGWLLWALSDGHGSGAGFRYGALVVGALLGTAVGVAGGRNVALLVAAPLLTVLAVVFGDLFGTALTEGDAAAQRGSSLTVMGVFTHHFGTLWRAWTHDFGVQRFVILWLSALVAYGLARRFGDR